MGKRDYRPSLAERTAEYFARTMLGERKLDLRGRESAQLPVAFCRSERLAPGLYRVWIGFEYMAGPLTASAMVYRLTIFNPETFARASCTGIEGEKLKVIEARCSPFHQHKQFLEEGWDFDETVLNEHGLWCRVDSPLVDAARLQGTLIALQYAMPDAPLEYEVRMANETPVVLGKRVLGRWQFTDVDEYCNAWREFDKLKRRKKAKHG